MAKTATATAPAATLLSGLNFVCEQSALNSHLSLVSKAVPTRPSRPVLGNVLMRLSESDQTVTLIGFDEAMGIQTTFPAMIGAGGGGEITLPAKLLGDIVSRLPATEMTIAQVEGEDAVNLITATGNYLVRGLSAEDYPLLPTPEGDDAIAVELPAEALLRSLQSTLFSVSSDETKQVLTGCHLAPGQGGGFEVASTDGHRLCVYEAETEAEQSTSIEMTIPGKALRELERMLNAYTGNVVTLHADRVQAVFEIGSQRLTTRLLEGQYPNYRQLIPKQFARQATLDRRQFIASLERVAVLAGQKNDIVRLDLTTDQKLAISAEAQEVGTAREEMPVQFSGEELAIAFNCRYLLEGLKAFSSTEVQFHFNGPTSPAAMTPLGETRMTVLTMPVQIRS